MPRRRRSRRSVYRPLKTAKYSNETFSFQQQISTYTQNEQYPVLVSKSTDVLGTRKAKNFTINFLSSSAQIPFLFALVFVPEGTAPSPLTWGSAVDSGYLISASMYNPNQNVILSGITAGFNQGVTRLKTRLARNLNSGDRIVLVMKPLGTFTDPIVVCGTVNYAISY